LNFEWLPLFDIQFKLLLVARHSIAQPCNCTYLSVSGRLAIQLYSYMNTPIVHRGACTALQLHLPERVRPPCHEVGLFYHDGNGSSNRGQAKQRLQLAQPQQHLVTAV
jgi:hypothetical protein